MPKFVNLTGEKFGRLEVLHLDKETKDKRTRWIVNCSLCNIKFSIRSNNLISSKVQRCGQCRLTPDESEWIGKTIGDFTILKFDGFYGKIKTGWWIAKHKDGSIRKIKTSSLKDKRALKHLNKDNVNSSICELYRKYKYGASKRNLTFELELNDFSCLIFDNCFYCESEPSNIQKSKNKNRYPIKYNGIDRKNNLIGYTKENVVTSCITCNRAKSNLTYESWINYIQKLTNSFMKKGANEKQK